MRLTELTVESHRDVVTRSFGDVRHGMSLGKELDYCNTVSGLTHVCLLAPTDSPDGARRSRQHAALVIF